ncbi:MAG: DPP IV N-terminal domain-containing protein, partial [Pseudomonadota bacterium]|nr:DPP IV N-terminal domain-containing protein [Pseudomonadota bacterium]
MKLTLAVLPLCLLAALSAHAATRGLQAHDLATLDRLSSPTLSPDGRQLVFAKRVVDFDGNKSASGLWIEDLSARDAAPPKRLTPEGWNVNSPSFSPDGKTVYFLSGKSDTSQLYSIPTSGGTPKQLTAFALDIGTYHLSPDGSRIAFSADTHGDCGADFGCTKTRLDVRE